MSTRLPSAPRPAGPAADSEPGLGALLDADSIVVVGASADPSRLGGMPVRSLLEGGFPRDRLLLVNPKYREIDGVPCFDSVDALPWTPTLAVLAIRAADTLPVLERCHAMPYVRKGKLRPLAVAGAARLDALPDVQTFGEQGFPDLVPGIWAGLSGPPGMPADVVAWLGAHIKAVFDTASFQDRLRASGNEPWYMSPAQMLAYVKENTQTWGDFIRANRIRVD